MKEEYKNDLNYDNLPMMKIVRSKEIENYIAEINDINELNLSLADMFLDVIANKEIDTDPVIKRFEKGELFNEQYIELIREYWGLQLESEEDQDIYDRYIKSAFLPYDKKELLDNPYYKNIHINHEKYGKYTLTYDKYRPYEIFSSDDITIDDNYIEQSHLGYINEETPFIVLNEKDVTWMSITPNEIRTMAPSVKEAQGKVLVFGLGLGYYPYMISLKSEVKEITIVEKDETIISLFKKHILPQFSHKEKIRIVKEDAYLVKENELSKYDYVFIDLWHTPIDGIKFFVHFKRLENKLPKVTFSYWLNTSFYALLRRAMISLILEQYDGLKEDSYTHEENEQDWLINLLYQKSKNLTINTKKELENLLTSSSLISLIL